MASIINYPAINYVVYDVVLALRDARELSANSVPMPVSFSGLRLEERAECIRILEEEKGWKVIDNTKEKRKEIREKTNNEHNT